MGPTLAGARESVARVGSGGRVAEGAGGLVAGVGGAGRRSVVTR
jgi:hypothetical protein